MKQDVIKIKKKIAKVKWQDILALTNVSVKESLEKKFDLTESIGFLLENNNRRVVLLSTRDPDAGGETNDIIIIPRGVVKKITILKEIRKK